MVYGYMRLRYHCRSEQVWARGFLHVPLLRRLLFGKLSAILKTFHVSTAYYVTDQYQAATTDLVHAVSLLRQIHAASINDASKENYGNMDHAVKYHHDNDEEFYVIPDVTFQQHNGNYDDVTVRSRDNASTALNTVAILTDSLAHIAEQLTNRMHIAVDELKLPTADVSREQEAVAQGYISESRESRSQHDVTSGLLRYSNAKQMFQAAHVIHLCSIGILGIFVAQVSRQAAFCYYVFDGDT